MRGGMVVDDAEGQRPPWRRGRAGGRALGMMIGISGGTMSGSGGRRMQTGDFCKVCGSAGGFVQIGVKGSMVGCFCLHLGVQRRSNTPSWKISKKIRFNHFHQIGRLA